MRHSIMWALSLCLLKSAYAATYYFSSVSGNDSYSSTQAKNPSTPWKSINKLNSIFSILQPGDIILFKRGETFYGTIKPSRSGTSAAPITLGAYGSGNKPVITGFVTLSNWVGIGGGKYESYNAALGSTVNVVNFKGIHQEMGRYPNSNAANGGFLSFESHGSNYIKDNQLTSTTNWTGAELVTRTNRFVIDRSKITNHASSTLYYSPGLSYAPLDGFGYFIQNDIRTLDRLGEWYYKPATKKLTVYFGSVSPSSYPVQASALNRLVDINDKDNIIFDNLAFRGANQVTIYIYNANNIQVKNCDISFSNEYAILTNSTQKFLALNNTINYTQNTAILIYSASYATVKGNTITNTGLLHGMGMDSASMSLGIYEIRGFNGVLKYSSNTVIEGNSIENTGSHAIRFTGNYALIKNNFIRNYNLTKDDGAGIYTNNRAGVTTTGQKIIGNIVLNGIGAPAGTNSPIAQSTYGIYLDDFSTNVEIAGNTVASVNHGGLFIHNSRGVNAHDNTCYDNKIQLMMVHDKLAPDFTLRNITIKNNVLFAKRASQTLLSIKTLGNDISSMGTIDYNTYSRPLDKEGYFIFAQYNVSTTNNVQILDFEGWKRLYKKDLNGKVSATLIKPHTLRSLIGSNRFPNGSFNTNIDGMEAYSAASYTKKWVASKLDNGTFQGTLSSSTPSLYITNIPIGGVTAGKKYVVKFSAQGSRDTSMNLYFRSAGAPYTMLSNDGVKNVMKISTGRREYEFVYMPKVSESNTKLFLEVNARNQSFWLDNIKVYEADAVLTNPDDYIMLVYNASTSSKTVALGDDYVDAKGKSYSSSIYLAPYASAILVKSTASSLVAAGLPDQNTTGSLTSLAPNENYATTAAIEGKEVMMSSPASPAESFRLYPNPAVDKVFVAFETSITDNKRANLAITNIAGNVVKNMPVTFSGNGFEVDITSLAPGTYVLTILGDGFMKAQKFLKAQ